MYIKYQDQDDQFMTKINQQNKQLRPLQEAKGIQDFDDKFGLEKIKNFKTLLNHLEESDYSYQINDLVYFLRKIVEISQQGGIRRHELEKNRKFQKLVDHIKVTLKLGNHYKYPQIGSIAYCFKQLNIQDEQLWELFEEKMLDDDWLTNFKESVYAIEAFGDFYQGKDQKRIEQVYKRIERIVNLTVWEVDMTYYKRIVEGLVQVNRTPENLFAKIENHVINNLSMSYEVETIVDILFAFAQADKGSKKFYDAMQHTIQKGHLFHKNPFLHNRLDLPFQGRIVSKLVEIYGKTIEREPEFTINPDFRAMVYKYLVNKKTTYELPDLSTSMKYLNKFDFEDQPQIEQDMVQKILRLENVSSQEVIEFYEFLGDQLENKLSPQIMQFLEHQVFAHLKLVENDCNQVYFVGKYFLDFNKNAIQNKHLLTKLMETTLSNQFMKMEQQQIQNYIQLFESHGIEIDNRQKYRDYMLISQFNKIDPTMKLVNKKKKPRFLNKF